MPKFATKDITRSFFMLQSVPGIVALMNWKTRAGKVKNVRLEQQLRDGIWWPAMFLCLNFLCKLLTFQLSEPKKQHTKNIGSIFMFMRVTIPGIPGNRRRKSTLINKKKRVDSKLNGCSRAFKPGVKVCLNATWFCRETFDIVKNTYNWIFLLKSKIEHLLNEAALASEKSTW